ncbi:DUF448 domain-containing protein [Synechococcales cyanobacterium C]|uniref:DUF448 domain-containing protein n=1 Tax=Petrachloros mirabilis ULC683 TaxID=2781853 RepID=A0A8K1ZVP6_9CYAN|nr:YlxR family protein [Petrachloros mirabilis]NCJ04977.1 DUF448 domain-containing protein [Petrachloros mirabilis ULC683]
MEPNLRRCVSCRRVAPKSAFWRVLRLAHNGQVQLDYGMGRSAYLCAQSECLQQAQKKKRLERALRTAIAPEIYQILWQRLSAPSVDESGGSRSNSQ